MDEVLLALKELKGQIGSLEGSLNQRCGALEAKVEALRGEVQPLIEVWQAGVTTVSFADRWSRRLSHVYTRIAGVATLGAAVYLALKHKWEDLWGLFRGH